MDLASAKSNLRSDPDPTLTAILERWVSIELKRHSQQVGALWTSDADLRNEVTANHRAIVLDMAERTRPFLLELLRDQSSKSAEELENLAANLSPGGAHTGGLLTRLIRANLWMSDPLLLAALVRYNWHGGKIGFQFLPDPAMSDADEYEQEAMDLMGLFDEALDGDPHRLLTGEDRAFFDSLPQTFTIYRGCAGIAPEQGATGVCWTTRRDVAEWFAARSAGFSRSEPILLTARVRKVDVRLAKASEFEVVTMPGRARRIACRLRKRETWRPTMQWIPATA